MWNEDNTSQSLADATGGYSQTSEKANRLAHMYRRPFELMHRVSLEEVCSKLIPFMTVGSKRGSLRGTNEMDHGEYHELTRICLSNLK